MGFKPRSTGATKLVAFLRAINVGGRRIKSHELCASFASAGLRDVSAFLASGNVIFDDPGHDAGELEARIAAQLHADLGYTVDSFVRSTTQLVDIRATAPTAGLDRASGDDMVYVGFTSRHLGPGAIAALAQLNNAVDQLHCIGREIYWVRHRRVGDSLVSNAELERALGFACTVRNLNTVDRLLAKLPGAHTAADV